MDDDLERYLRMIGAVLIVGPKWCGKTTTAERHAKSVIKLQDPKRKETYEIWAEFDPDRSLTFPSFLFENCFRKLVVYSSPKIKSEYDML